MTILFGRHNQCIFPFKSRDERLELINAAGIFILLHHHDMQQQIGVSLKPKRPWKSGINLNWSFILRLIDFWMLCFYLILRNSVWNSAGKLSLQGSTRNNHNLVLVSSNTICDELFVMKPSTSDQWWQVFSPSATEEGLDEPPGPLILTKNTWTSNAIT